MLALALAATLSQQGVRRTGTDDVTVAGVVDTLSGDHRLCQDEELLPAGTSAVELRSAAGGRPTLAVEALDAATGAPVARGASGRWQAATVTVPLRPPATRDRQVRICVSLRRPSAHAVAALYGEPSAEGPGATDGGLRLDGRVRLDYVRAGTPSWASFAPTIVARIGRAQALAGASAALLAGLLMLLATALAAWLLVRTS